MAFSGFNQHIQRGVEEINAGFVFGWNSDSENPKYYNILITGKRILLESIGFNGGDAFRDFQHLNEGVYLKINENQTYELNFRSRVFSYNQLK